MGPVGVLLAAESVAEFQGVEWAEGLGVLWRFRDGLDWGGGGHDAD